MSYMKNSLPPSHPLNQGPLDKDLCSEEYLQEIAEIQRASNRISQQSLHGTIAQLDKFTRPQVTRQDFEQYRKRLEEEKHRNLEQDRSSLEQSEAGMGDGAGLDGMEDEEIYGFESDAELGKSSRIEELASGEEDGDDLSQFSSWRSASIESAAESREKSLRHRSPTSPASATQASSATAGTQKRREEYLDGVGDRRLAAQTQNRQTAAATTSTASSAAAPPPAQPLRTAQVSAVAVALGETDTSGNILTTNLPTKGECFFCLSHNYFISGTFLFRYCARMMDAVNACLIWAHDPTIYMIVDWYNSLRKLAGASGIILPFMNHAMILNHLRNHCQLIEATKFEMCMDLKAAFKVAMRNAITLNVHNGVIAQEINPQFLKTAMFLSNQLKSWSTIDTTKVNPRTAKWIEYHARTAGEADFDFNPANERNPFTGSQWNNPPFLQDVRMLAGATRKITR